MCITVSECQTTWQVLFAQLTHGTRTYGGQQKQLKDITKHYTKKGQIDISAWELMAADHLLWCRSIHHAVAKFETNRLLHEAEKRHRRGRYLNILMSPFHLAFPDHTETRSADHESGSWVTSGHMTNNRKTPSSFRGTADDDDYFRTLKSTIISRICSQRMSNKIKINSINTVEIVTVIMVCF